MTTTSSAHNDTCTIPSVVVHPEERYTALFGENGRLVWAGEHGSGGRGPICIDQLESVAGIDPDMVVRVAKMMVGPGEMLDALGVTYRRAYGESYWFDAVTATTTLEDCLAHAEAGDNGGEWEIGEWETVTA